MMKMHTNYRCTLNLLFCSNCNSKIYLLPDSAHPQYTHTHTHTHTHTESPRAILPDFVFIRVPYDRCYHISRVIMNLVKENCRKWWKRDPLSWHMKLPFDFFKQNKKSRVKIVKEDKTWNVLPTPLSPSHPVMWIWVQSQFCKSAVKREELF